MEVRSAWLGSMNCIVVSCLEEYHEVLQMQESNLINNYYDVIGCVMIS
jgi:hypothetical protein